MSDQPLELDPGHVTIGQATTTYVVSASTLRRKLRAGAVPGAMQVSSAYGEQWAVPVTWLAANYLTRGQAGTDAPAPPTQPTVDAATLLALVDKLQGLVELTLRQQLDARQEQLQLAQSTAEATAHAASLEAELERQRETVAALESRQAELQAELDQARRRWWRRR